MSGGLLAKLRAREQGATTPAPEAAIRAHLSELLNARQGGCALDPHYGLPDLTDLTHRVPEGVPMLQRAITEAIRRYEPRLRKLRVLATTRAELASPRPCLHFELHAELAGGAALCFQTDVAPGGHVRVS